MFPAQIQFGPLHLPTYAALLSLGWVGGVAVSAWQGRRLGLAPAWPFDAALLGASGGLVGARATYVLINWSYYEHHLSEALRLWAGGLAWQGGLVVGLSLIVLYAARFHLPLGMLLDALAPGLAWFMLCLWLGSGAANDVYGHETFPGDRLWPLSADLPDLYGLRAPRVNVPLLGAVWSGLVFVVVGLVRGRAGASFLACLALTGAGGLALVFLQANLAPTLFRLRLDGLFNLTLIAVGLGGMVVSSFEKHRRDT